MNNDIEQEACGAGPHGTLTIKRLFTLCCVGAIVWAGILLTAIKLYEVM